jgi:choline dehydrogenase-like flavoprotein
MSKLSLGPIVVGSGPVGLSIAVGLAQAGMHVRLIEAGNDYSDPAGVRLLTPVSTGDHLQGAVVGRTRQLGGGLNLWGGQLAWPSTVEWAEGMNLPVGSVELEHDAQAAIGFVGARKRELHNTKLITNLESSFGRSSELGFEFVTTSWLSKPKLSEEFWRTLQRNPRIELIKGFFVDRILLDSTGDFAGVGGIRPDGSRSLIHGNFLILAAGTIETVRLLCQPDACLQEQPWAQNDWLGRGFSDHLDANVATIRPKNASALSEIFDPFFDSSVKFTAKLRTSTLSSDGDTLSSAMMLVAPGNIRNSLSELRLLLRGLTPKTLPGSYSKLGAATLASFREIGPLAWRYLRHKRLGTVLQNGATLRVLAEQPTRRDSRISLSSSERDMYGVPKANLNWVRGATEGEVFLDAARKAKRMFETLQIADVIIDPRLEENATDFAKLADDGLHHSGGARVGSSPKNGVVNGNLEVFGARGVFCCGASVLPRMGFGNPTLIAMALGQRLVRHLVKRKVS